MNRREAAILSLSEYHRVLKEGGELPYGYGHYVIPERGIVSKSEYNLWWRQKCDEDNARRWRENVM